MDVTKLDEALELLETFHAVKDKLKHLDNILATDTDKDHKRNFGGFFIISWTVLQYLQSDQTGIPGVLQ